MKKQKGGGGKRSQAEREGHESERRGTVYNQQERKSCKEGDVQTRLTAVPRLTRRFALIRRRE
jgi:hypothetical protein